MSRTNIDIDDELIATVMRQYRLKTKKDAVDFALRRVVKPAVDREFLLSLRGIGWEGDLEAMRSADPIEEIEIRPDALRHLGLD